MACSGVEDRCVTGYAPWSHLCLLLYWHKPPFGMCILAAQIRLWWGLPGQISATNLDLRVTSYLFVYNCYTIVAIVAVIAVVVVMALIIFVASGQASLQ